MLKALARRTDAGGRPFGILPTALGVTNRHHTPYWAVVVYLVISVGVIAAARGRDQELVLFYAVAVFVSFLAGLIAMARFSRREGSVGHMIVNWFGAAVVVFTIAINLRRGYPIASLVATLIIGAIFYRSWTVQGRPRGIAMVEAESERELAED